jgi:hypothetical protein
VDCLDNPVDTGIAADSLVLGIDENDLVVLVGRVLVDPVGIEDTEVGTAAADTLFSGGSERALVLELVHTLVRRLACVQSRVSVGSVATSSEPFLTICSTLWHWSLAASTANADTIDNVSLLGLVSEPAGFVRSRRTRSTVNDMKLSEPTN